MKNILGLDLGSGSIGWSVIQEGENNRTILGMGSRIIPLSPDDTTQFTQGKSITKNADRTAFRTQRTTATSCDDITLPNICIN